MTTSTKTSTNESCASSTLHRIGTITSVVNETVSMMSVRDANEKFGPNLTANNVAGSAGKLNAKLRRRLQTSRQRVLATSLAARTSQRT